MVPQPAQGRSVRGALPIDGALSVDGRIIWKDQAVF
jgi:hypothetical protein